MPQSVRAVYEDGLLRPLDSLTGIAEHSEVKLIVRGPRQSPQSLAERLGVLPNEDTEEVVRAIEEELESADADSSGGVPEGRETIKELASFLRLVACLTDLDQLKPGWNTYQAEPPGPLAMRTSLRILRVLYSANFLPDRVLPLADGGAALVYSRGSLYANFECYNDGEVTAGISNRSDFHDAWDVESVESGAVLDAAKRIRAFLNG